MNPAVSTEELRWDSIEDLKVLYEPIPVFDCGRSKQKISESDNHDVSEMAVKVARHVDSIVG